MVSENPSGADDQQERPGFAQWVVGFVDGEGCFSISVVKHPGCRLGWQVQHEFSVTQGASSRSALSRLVRFFGCGRIIENRRSDDHREPLLRYSVKGRHDLLETIIPFFEAHPLITVKSADFEKFATIVSAMSDGVHLRPEGLEAIARATETMNRRARSRYLESSEAIRRPPRFDERGEDMVLAPWRHGEP